MPWVSTQYLISVSTEKAREEKMFFQYKVLPYIKSLTEETCVSITSNTVLCQFWLIFLIDITYHTLLLDHCLEYILPKPISNISDDIGLWPRNVRNKNKMPFSGDTGNTP